MWSALNSWLTRRRLERILPNPRSAKPTRAWHSNRSQRYWMQVRRTVLARLILALCLLVLAVVIYKAAFPPPHVLLHG